MNTTSSRWPNVRLCIIQYGDFRTTALRLEHGGEETFFNQRQQVEHTIELGKRSDAVAQICLRATGHYEEIMANGIHVFGDRLWDRGRFNWAPFLDFIRRFGATHAMVATPSSKIIRSLVRCEIATLPSFADSFQTKGLRAWWHHYRLRRVLNHPAIPWVANHNLPAARSLARIGVLPTKIIPWDYEVPPVHVGARCDRRPEREAMCRLIYVGQAREAKGVGDLIEATALLRRAGRSVVLVIIGSGEVKKFVRQAGALGIGDHVCFKGQMGHEKVLEQIKAHDLLIVPSRPSYPEGLPMVIYESLIVGTPLVYSDHPVLEERLVDGRHGVRFRSGDPSSLCQSIQRLMDDLELRKHLQQNRQERLDELRVPATPREIIERWLDDHSADRTWLKSHTLASGRYDAPSGANHHDG